MDAMELRIEKMGAISESLDHLDEEMQELKRLQNDIMDQQRKVDSLQNLVVVVDESNSEGACAALEKKLAMLGERWAMVSGNSWWIISISSRFRQSNT